MTLAEYIETDDDNAFWRMTPGEHLNLLAEAVDALEDVYTLETVAGATLADATAIARRALNGGAEDD